MMDWKLDNTGDLDFSRGGLQMTTGVDAIRQRLSMRLKTFAGEWHLDTRAGVPYMTDIFGKGRSMDFIRAKMRAVITGCPGVVSLSEFSAELDNATRRLSVSFVARTTSGETLDYSEGYKA